ncbi:GNAT family N-acetyltransferase [Rheinheimera marina]|uniref:GNAT family N-acetyltransferase n=1 Tax=Rheinheimera marina TaxID=1774958 RepID=A0ABV9JLF7_9GAMM
MWIQPGPLQGQHVSLEPLTEQHTEALSTALRDGESWKLWYAFVPNPDELALYVQQAVQGAERGEQAFVVKLAETGQVVGTTRFYQVDAANKRALIGYTWYAESVRRTAVNTETKYLMLRHLFEQCGAIAAEFRTHFFNQTSRNAIERLGARQDGILRNHMIMKDGSYRDTVVYSIIASEWPAVRTNLLFKLSQHHAR